MENTRTVNRHRSKPSYNRNRKADTDASRLLPFRKYKEDFDMPFFLLILVLVVFGTVMMFSASYAWGINEANDGYMYLKKQSVIGFIGIVFMLLVSRVDYNIFKRPKVVWTIFLSTLALLAYTSFFGISRHDARRWLKIGVEFQPSEIMKFALVVLFAYWINKRKMRNMNMIQITVTFGSILAIIAGLMMKQRHLSGTLLLLSIGLIMIFVGGVKWKYIAILGISSIVLVGCLIAYKVSVEGMQYITHRIDSWRDPMSDSTGNTYQTYQSLIAIGSGGLFGLGFGESRQKFLYLPEAQNDFIFAIVCEELGLFGAMIVILLFILFIMRGFYIASKAPDKLSMMLVVGLTVQIGLQAFLNIAVATNAIPNTGISLPFFSYGGTALAMQLAQMGVILNISRYANIKK